MTSVLYALSLVLAAPTPPVEPPATKSPGGALRCPKGSRRIGGPPATGVAQYCVRDKPDGAVERHGPYVLWHSATVRSLSGAYHEGLRHGLWVARDGLGRLRKRIAYHRGKVTHEVLFERGSATVARDHLTGGARREVYFRDGVKVREVQLLGDKRHGTLTRYWPNGRRRSIETYQHGLEHGVWKRFRRTGRLWLQWSQAQGRWHGLFYRWRPDGTLHRTGAYRHGKAHGCWRSWNRAGRLESVRCYAAGQPHGPWQIREKDGGGWCTAHFAKGTRRSDWQCPQRRRLADGESAPFRSPTPGAAPQPVAELQTPWLHPTGWAFGVGGTGFFPYGRWTAHPYAGTLGPSDLDQVGPGGGALIELGHKWRRVSLFFQFDIASLSTGQWTHWAAEQGAALDARALVYGFNLSLGVDLFHVGRFRLELRAGIGLMDAWGEERNRTEDLDYEYTFLKPSFLFRSGLLGGYELANGYELIWFLDHTVGTPGMDLGDGNVRPYLAFTLGVGMRFWTKRAQ